MSKMTLKKIGFGMISIWFFIMLFFTSIQILLNFKPFFIRYYDVSNIEEKIGINSEQCYGVIKQLVDFMEKKSDNLKLDGRLLQFNSFSFEEVQHMIYIREIYQNLILVRNISFIFYLIMLAYFIYHKSSSTKYNVIGFISTSVLLAGIALFVVIDFDSFWNVFHDIILGSKNVLFSFDSSIMINVCTYGLDKAFIFTSILLYIVLSSIIIVIFKLLHDCQQKKVDI